MAKIRIFNIGGKQLRVSPFLHKEGELIRCTNMETDMVGAKKKRPGYTTYLGTVDNSQVNSLFNWTKDDGTTLFNYRASGSALYYSIQGTGDWTLCGNGTISDGAHVGHATINNTLMIGDGVGATRHTTNGTSFTNTTAAPIASDFVPYQGRMWAMGTASFAFYSRAGTHAPIDWTTDSSSHFIGGGGKLNKIFKSNDRLVFNKNSGVMQRFDGYNLLDLATNLGFTSPYSVGEVEGYRIGLNRLGFFGYGGNRPEIISNPVQRQIYNDAGKGIVGTIFDNAPGVVHKYDYLCSVGTVTDDLTNVTIPDCIMRYNYQLDEWDDWKFANRPTAFCSYKDENGNQKLIFGDANGQCYTQGGTNLTDNGTAIDCVMEGVLHFGQPESDKRFNYIWAFTNPGCQAKIQVAISDTFTKGKKNWVDMKQLSDGVMETKFSEGRGKLLFWKVSEASKDSRFQFYGFTVSVDFIERK